MEQVLNFQGFSVGKEKTSGIFARATTNHHLLLASDIIKVMWIKISLVMFVLSLAQSKPMPQASYGNPGVVYMYDPSRAKEFVVGMRRKLGEILYQRKDKVIDVGESGKTIRRYVRI